MSSEFLPLLRSAGSGTILIATHERPDGDAIASLSATASILKENGFHALAILPIPIINGLETMLLFLALKGADTFFRRHGWFVQGIIWVAYEYLSESWFAGFPYGNIAYAFYRAPLLTQIADVTGIWGIAFLAVVPQAFRYKIRPIFPDGQTDDVFEAGRRGIFILLSDVLP